VIVFFFAFGRINSAGSSAVQSSRRDICAHLYNSSGRDDGLIYSIENVMSSLQDGQALMHHGCTEFAAESIMKYGPLAACGRLVADFSRSEGFYLTDTFGFAAQRAVEVCTLALMDTSLGMQISNVRPIVISFIVDISVMQRELGSEFFDALGSDMLQSQSDRINAWGEYVGWCRKSSMVQSDPRQDALTKIIFGPMCKNTNEVYCTALHVCLFA
jgi:hypothetical protein